MAQSRPTTTTDGGKALAKTIVDLEKRVRTLELREDPTDGGGGGVLARGARSTTTRLGRWQGYRRLCAGSATSIDEQSGGFTLVDSMTLALPDSALRGGVVVQVLFPFTNPYTGGYFGRLGALAQAARSPSRTASATTPSY
jgi:hypothetical protein